MKTIKDKSTPVTAMLKAAQIVKTCLRTTFLTMGMGLVLFPASVFSSRAAGPALVRLHGHVPAIVSQLRAEGDVPADTNLNLAIGLPLRNREALTNLLEQIYDPSSTNYHHFLTSEQFTEQFGPTKEDYEMVLNFAKVSGFKVTGTYPNRMLLDVSGKASDVQKAFHVTLRTYRHPTEKRDFFAPDTEPTIDSALPILHVSGLDNYIVPRPALVRKPTGNQPAIQPAVGSGPSGTYAGKDFRAAYVPGTSLNGSGQAVALLELDGYFSTDIATYEAQTGLPNVPLQNVLLDGFSGVPGFNNGEVALDIEVAVAMAPGLSTVIVYEAPNGRLAFVTDLLNRLATDNLAKQISSSWLIGDNPSWDQIYQQMAVQGQSFFQASGDNDAYNWSIFGQQRVDDPFITTVGGTTLTMNGSGASYASETVWNWDIEFGPIADGIGSGGGISPNYTIPTWQTNINMTPRQGSATMRNVPDVALTADNIYIVADNGQQENVGGTSAASPLWAGFTALINQQAALDNHAPVGFINPAIYAVANGPNYNNCFHDITTGNNEWSGSPNLFSAVRGYDLCTGLGTPKGTNLINALTAVGVTNTITHLSPPPPPYGSTLAALNGGNPNGTWQLYVLDDTLLNDGIISNGWILALTTASPVGESADLALTMTASASAVLVSNNITYTLTVTNYGPSTSSNVLVSDTLPLNVTVLPYNNPDQGSVSHNGQVLNWNVGSLGTNAGSQFVFTVRPNAPGNLLNYAIASAATPDANPADDFATTNVLVYTVTPPRLSGSYVGGNHQFQFSIADPSLQAYVVQASTNLVDWVPIYTNPSPATTTTIFPDANATNYPYRFYRVLVQ